MSCLSTITLQVWDSANLVLLGITSKRRILGYSREGNVARSVRGASVNSSNSTQLQSVITVESVSERLDLQREVSRIRNIVLDSEVFSVKRAAGDIPVRNNSVRFLLHQVDIR